MKPEQIAERFADARPGFVLASYGEVALPFYRVRMRLQILERKSIGPLEEFVLRSVGLGISGSNDIGDALGLDAPVVEATLVGLLENEALAFQGKSAAKNGVLKIAPKGREILDGAREIYPRDRILDIDFDGLLRIPTPYVRPHLVPRQVEESGMREIPSHPAKPPDRFEMREHVREIEHVIRTVGDARDQLNDVLAVRGVERRVRIFQPAIALVYKAEETKRSQPHVEFVINGKLSESHGKVFANAGLSKKLGIAKRGIEDSSQLFSRFFGKSPPEPSGPKTTADPDAKASAEKDEQQVRSVATYEHPKLLMEAIETSSERLLLVSPWLRRGVVDRNFLDSLQLALERGVHVYLGWGLSASETNSPDADPGVREQLEGMASSFGNFHFKRLGRTHAKVLICDQRFVIVTSFNWLSFRGDPKRTFRDERGTYVSDPQFVENQFADWISRFEPGDAPA